MVIEDSKALVTTGQNVSLRNKSFKVSAIQRAEADAADYVPHVTSGPVRGWLGIALCAACMLS